MDPISEMITCFRSWLPEVRVLGNVQAGPAADALESMQADLHTYQTSLREANVNRMGMIEMAEKLQARIKDLESEGRFSGTWADYHDHMTRKVSTLEARVAELESGHPEWMKRIQRERQEERERIYNLLLATNPMDVSICDPIHGDQWIAVALYDLIQPK